jgi:hypothetical protein
LGQAKAHRVIVRYQPQRVMLLSSNTTIATTNNNETTKSRTVTFVPMVCAPEASSVDFLVC